MAKLFDSGFALVIGVGSDLPVTVTDAKAIHAHLTDPDFCAYPPANVTLLIEQEARRYGVLAALDVLAARASVHPDATVIVYFSGHGVEHPAPYLITHGYDLGDLDGTTIHADIFTEKLRAIQSKKLLVLLDCCHAGAQGEAKAPMAKTPIPLTQSAINELSKSSGRVIIASSRKDEKSWTGNPYSQFTVALLEGLAGYGAFEEDGYARVLDMAMWANRVVPLRTSDTQHPILKISNLQDNFAVSYYAGGADQPKSLPFSSPKPSLGSGSTAERFDEQERATWRRMLGHRRTALLLIQERISQFIEYERVPLQYILNERTTQEQIAELEAKLRL